MNALEKLLKIAKFGKTLNRIILFLSILLMIVVLVFFMFFLIETESSNSRTVHVTGRLDSEFIVETNDIILYFLSVIFYLVKSIYSSNLCIGYFSLVIREKTPFKADAAKMLEKLAVIAVLLPVINDIVTSVFMYFISSEIFNSSVILNYNPVPSIALGAMFFVCSAISKYGSEVRAGRKSTVTA